MRTWGWPVAATPPDLFREDAPLENSGEVGDTDQRAVVELSRRSSGDSQSGAQFPVPRCTNGERRGQARSHCGLTPAIPAAVCGERRQYILVFCPGQGEKFSVWESLREGAWGRFADPPPLLRCPVPGASNNRRTAHPAQGERKVVLATDIG